MSKNKRGENDCKHQTGCGCMPTLFANIIENAGLELSRREFIKEAGAAGGVLFFGGIASSAFAGSKALSKDAKADAIYHGGPILTMTKDGDRAEALAVQNGHIMAVGTLAEVMATKGPNTKLIDLGGKTLMPGFFDPHSHLVMQSVKFSTANLDPKPIGEAGSISDIQRILRDWIKQKKIQPGKWVIGWGYDDTGIEEQRHPNRDDLDAVSTEHPILLMHISGHLMTGNSRILEEIDINAETKDPEGGKIQRKPGSSEPNGVLEENAMYLVLKKLPVPTPERTTCHGLRTNPASSTPGYPRTAHPTRLPLPGAPSREHSRQPFLDSLGLPDHAIEQLPDRGFVVDQACALPYRKYALDLVTVLGGALEGLGCVCQVGELRRGLHAGQEYPDE